MLFDADAADLERRCGVNEGTAVFFALVSEFIRRYNGEKWKPRKVMDSSDIAGEYCKFLLSYEKRECFYVICLDSQSRLISSALVSMGTVNETHVYTRSVVESALKFNARSIILAHNHPGGSLVPTSSDVETTINIIKALNMIDILVADHIIVAGDGYISMSDKGLVKNLDDV
jgi:DNA repair protein RadC